MRSAFPIVAVRENVNGRLYSLLSIATSGSAQLTVRTHEGRGTRLMRDGAAARNALNACFDAQNQEAPRNYHNDLLNLRHKAGGDPIDFFTKGWDLKLRLEVLGAAYSTRFTRTSCLTVSLQRLNSGSFGRCTTVTSLPPSTPSK